MIQSGRINTCISVEWDHSNLLWYVHLTDRGFHGNAVQVCVKCRLSHHAQAIVTTA